MFTSKMMPLQIRGFYKVSRRHCTLLCLLFGSVVSDAFGYLLAQPFPSFFHRLTPEQGLSQAVNSFVLHDSRGFVWVSSIDGLNRYDGHSVRVYRPNPQNSHAMVGKNMQSQFFEAPNGDLWFCTYEAVNCYRRRTDDFAVFRIHNAAGQVLEKGYYAFHFDRAGRLWLRAGEEEELYWFDTRIERQSPCKGHLSGVRCVVDTAASGAVRGIWSSFFRDSTGIQYTRLDDTAGVVSVRHFFTGKERGMPPLGVASIYLESDRLLWLASRQGLVRFNPKTSAYRVFQPILGKIERFWAIMPMNDSTLALSSPVGGVWLFDKKRCRFTRQILPEADNPMSLPDREVEEMHRDSTDNLWLSQWNTGLSHAHLRKQKFGHLQLRSLFPALRDRPFSITSLVEAGDGQMWCATEGAGILVLKNGRAAGRFLPDEQVVFLLKDHAGDWWALTRSGVFWRKAASRGFEKISARSELAFGLETSDHRLLVSGKGGIFEITKGPQEKLRILPAAGFERWDSTYVDWMHEDGNGTFYIGKDAATLCVVPRTKESKEYSFGYTKAAHEDPDGRSIWLATTSGLVRMNKDTFDKYTVLNETNGLPNQYLYSVIPDSTGRFWMGSNRGILRYSPDSNTVRQYTRSDGVWADEFYSNAWLTRSGEVWMGNRDVLNVFRPDAIQDVKTLPKIQITGLKVNDLAWVSDTFIGERRSLDFPFSENTLSFDFVALEYSDPARNRLSYQLEGYDENPVDLPPGALGFARYAKLPPGGYTLRIRAANSDGVWNPLSRELRIRIRPPYWQTWWFWLLVGTALAGAGYAAYRYRLRQIRREYGLRQIALEHELAARENALRAAESEMTALRAQMNPHFIFNSLNSINAFILRNEGPEASRYLDQFAQLMRQILDHSTRPTIRLEEEVEFLNNYLALEAVRMGGRLAYDIRLADDVDDFDTELPPMILQPFVENAIWHGLSPRSEGGLLRIDFKKENGTLVCTLEDNGVGREQARAQRKGGHESKGLKITAERLALHDQRHGTRSKVTTTDLVDGQGNAAGTLVTVHIDPSTH